MYRTIITYKKYIKTISKIIDLLDNPEKTATPDTQDEDKQNKKTPLYTSKHK
jgi:hypothetical protein